MLGTDRHRLCGLLLRSSRKHRTVARKDQRLRPWPEGLCTVVFALTIRPFPNWGWVLASGLVGILMALILWANLPVTALWLVGVLLSINLISVGAAITFLAWQIRQS
jgi:hypothetical protein